MQNEAMHRRLEPTYSIRKLKEKICIPNAMTISAIHNIYQYREPLLWRVMVARVN